MINSGMTGGRVIGGIYPAPVTSSYTSSSGSALDALAVVGQQVTLLGAATNAIIAVLRCETVSPVTYRVLGAINWFQASGTEFTGVFKPTAQGAATFGWGSGPGDRATAGLLAPTDGSLVISGLSPCSGTDRAISSIVRVLTLPDVSPANFSMIGFIDAATSLQTSGGFGITAGSTYSSMGCLRQSLTIPTLTPSVAWASAPSTTIEQVLLLNTTLQGAAGAGALIRGSLARRSGAEQFAAAPGGSVGGGSVDDKTPLISGRGIGTRHLITTIHGTILEV